MFIETNDAELSAKVAEGLNIVLFYKELCPFCKAMKKIIAKFAERPGVAERNITYLQIDRENNPIAVREMGIERVPTVLVFRNGERLFVKSGDVTYKELEKVTV